MSWRDQLLKRFDTATPVTPEPLALLDLTLWHQWHRARKTLPAGAGSTLPDACRFLRTPVWAPLRPWQAQYHDVQVDVEQTEEQRTIRYRTGKGQLEARWTLGPDGDWWQTDYLVKSAEDLPIAAEVVRELSYVVDAAALEAARAEVGEDGMVPLELPMQPYSELLHRFLGWGAGLLLLHGEGSAYVGEILAALDAKMRTLASHLANLAGEVMFAPDNLDGQYISPRAFRDHLAPSYAAIAAAAQDRGKRLVVHIGGPSRRLVPLLAQAGVHGLQGIAGPPQGDITMADARQEAGPEVVLWGGVPQDLLLEEHDRDAFEASVALALEGARADPRFLIGVADRVPPEADVERLRALIRMAA
jgi:hypothetical protein